MRWLFLLLVPFLARADQIETLYGKIDFNEPVLIELLQCQALHRLKEIDQHGVGHYCHITPAFSRYEHSIGVFHLLRRFNAPIKEQIAGLLHEVPQTIFSRVCDFIFDYRDGNKSYQETMYEWFIEKIALEPILKKYNLSTPEVAAKRPEFAMLEAPLPDLCIDRLEYNLHTAYLYNKLSKDEIEKIISDLTYEEGKLVFRSASVARKFADIPLYFNQNLWAADWNIVLYHWMGQAIRRAIELKLLTFDEVHLSSDRPVLDKLQASSDPLIQKALKMCKSHAQYFTRGDAKNFDYFYSPRFRGVNPLVRKEDKLYRLTDLDPDFEKEYKRVSTETHAGTYIRFINQ